MASPFKAFRDRLIAAAAPRLAYGYLRLVGLTSRIEWRDREIPESFARRGQPIAYAFWHGRQVFFTVSHRGYKAAIMVSRSKDGDIIAEVMRLSGLRAVRGSSSRGGVAALKELIDVIKEGYITATTPDGPRGPFHEVQPGILLLARESGVPIIPIANGMRRKLVFRGWDEYFFPLPFNHVVITHGKPIYVRPEDSFDEKAKELKAALDDVTRRADEAAG